MTPGGRMAMKGISTAVAVVATALAVVPAAEAGRVLRVEDGVASKARDPLLPSGARTRLAPVPRGTRVARPRPKARASSLTKTERSAYSGALRDARRVRDGLAAGASRDELSAVMATMERIDGRGELTSSRLDAVLMTLRRNTEFWKANQPPPPGTRVTFAGSPVILEYYVGRGLNIQPLGNFGKANAAWSECRRVADTTCTPLRELLDAMLDLASNRGGFLAWEYFFDFEGGAPPWMSGMSQGTGIQALSRAYALTGDVAYRNAATAALAAFETAPPVGVRRPATDGDHYLMYSYAPDLFIFNGFLQALVGLDDYRDYTGDPRGTTLFRAGHAHAKWLVPQSDTGSWSFYSLGGPESTREYHVLLRDILRRLCSRIGTPVYCDTANRFTGYLAE